MKRIILLVATISLVFMAGNLLAEEAIYAHITYIESNPKIIRSDQTVEDAVINLPLAPGDIIETVGDSRCEFQFDNGTVMRLDTKSRLKIVTVLAKSLTSKWKITTLELQKGKLYSVNQSYNQEKFQIITPNAAVHLKNNSKSIIGVGINGETNISIFRGKLKVMFGGEMATLKKKSILSGKSYTITTDHKLVEGNTSNLEFLTWNQYVNKNFKKLHYGISRVPAKIYRYCKAIVYWAEKWSSLFGEWVYDDVFGYVWQPADERFAYSARPFFHADFTRVNGKLFIVPSQPWGWAPAHLGTWVWLKRGWTWIPGSAFKPGFMSFQTTFWDARLFSSYASYAFPWPYVILSSSSVYPHPLGHYGEAGIYTNTIYYWISQAYGGNGFDSYYHYRQNDLNNPSFKVLPADVKRIIKTMNQTPVSKLKNALKGIPRELDRLKIYNRVKLSESKITSKGVRKQSKADISTAVKSKASKAITTRGKAMAPVSRGVMVPISDVKYFRDFNPDKRALQRIRADIKYVSLNNTIICPKLNISSRSMSIMDRHVLRSRLARTSVRHSNGLRWMGRSGYSNGVDSTSVTNSGHQASAPSSGHDNSASSRGGKEK